MQMYHAGIETLRKYAFIFFVGFSMFALLTLNIERFLALTCPFFHQAVITKGKLAIFLALQMLITVSVMGLYYFYPKTDVYRPIILTVFLLLILLILAFLNYKMLVIVKSKRENELRVAPTSSATPAHQGRNKKQKKNFKNISTCPLVLGCFLICSIPGISYATWSYTGAAEDR